MEVNAIKQTVSGHDYYYLYIKAGDNKQSNVEEAEAFVKKYYDLLAENLEETNKKIYNVSNYDSFDVTLLLPVGADGKVDSSKVGSGAAVTAQNKNDGSLYIQASTKSTMSVETALKEAATSKTFTMLLGNGDTTANNLAYENLKTSAGQLTGSDSETEAHKVSNFLNYMYINMKDHLSV